MDVRNGLRQMPHRRVGALFLAALLVVFLTAAWSARAFPFRARIFPMTVSLVGAILVFVELVLQRRGTPGARPIESRPPGSVARYVGWILLLFVTIAGLGFVPAAALFVAAFLRVEAKAGWLAAVLAGAATAAVLLGLSGVLRLEWVPPVWAG